MSELEQLRSDLEKVTTERDRFELLWSSRKTAKLEEYAALLARVTELESELLDTKTGAEQEARHADELQQRNAELVAALRKAGKFARDVEQLSAECQNIDEEVCVAVACECEDVLARAESATPAKHPFTCEQGSWQIDAARKQGGGAHD